MGYIGTGELDTLPTQLSPSLPVLIQESRAQTPTTGSNRDAMGRLVRQINIQRIPVLTSCPSLFLAFLPPPHSSLSLLLCKLCHLKLKRFFFKKKMPLKNHLIENEELIFKAQERG